MRWLADECVAAALVAQLRAAGHDVSYVVELAAGETDSAAIARAQQEMRLLLTEDKDFGELIFRRNRKVPGLVLLRIDPARAALRQQRLMAAIDRFGDALFGRHTVIDEFRFRSRPLQR